MNAGLHMEMWLPDIIHALSFPFAPSSFQLPCWCCSRCSTCTQSQQKYIPLQRQQDLHRVMSSCCLYCLYHSLQHPTPSLPPPSVMCFRLFLKSHSGTAGRQSSLVIHGADFSTKDMDNDNCMCKCALMLTGGECSLIRLSLCRGTTRGTSTAFQHHNSQVSIWADVIIIIISFFTPFMKPNIL